MCRPPAWERSHNALIEALSCPITVALGTRAGPSAARLFVATLAASGGRLVGSTPSFTRIAVGFSSARLH
jgi:hypothetical protein